MPITNLADTEKKLVKKFVYYNYNISIVKSFVSDATVRMIAISMQRS